MNSNPDFNLAEAPVHDPFLEQTFYKNASIGAATFLGGPLGGGILIRRNLINFGKAKEGNIALVVSIIFMLLLVAIFIFIPAHIIEKIPTFLLPMVYTGAITLWTKRNHGDALDVHEAAGGNFYSGWKAAGIGLLALVVFFACLAPSILIENQRSERYVELNTSLVAQEDKAAKIPQPYTNETTAVFLKETGIPAWEKNLKTVEEMDKIDGLSKEFIDRNLFLTKFYKLKLRIYKLLLKASEENTTKYDEEMRMLNEEITVLSKSSQ